CMCRSPGPRCPRRAWHVGVPRRQEQQGPHGALGPRPGQRGRRPRRRRAAHRQGSRLCRRGGRRTGEHRRDRRLPVGTPARSAWTDRAHPGQGTTAKPTAPPRRTSPRPVYPAGQSDAVPAEILSVVQDSLVDTLAGWHVEHGEQETLARAADGTLLLVRVARHPHAGWGLMVAVGGDLYRCDPETAGRFAAGQNRVESDRARRGPSPGCWTYNGAGLEYRAFLPAALLDAEANRVAAAGFVLAVVSAIARRGDASLLDRDPAVRLARFWNECHGPATTKPSAWRGGTRSTTDSRIRTASSTWTAWAGPAPSPRRPSNCGDPASSPKTTARWTGSSAGPSRASPTGPPVALPARRIGRANGAEGDDQGPGHQQDPAGLPHHQALGRRPRNPGPRPQWVQQHRAMERSVRSLH